MLDACVLYFAYFKSKHGCLIGLKCTYTLTLNFYSII